MATEVVNAPSAHLGVKWEIVLVTVFVVILFVILGTVWFQIRRKRRRNLLDAEAGSRIESRSRRSSREKGNGPYSGLSMPDPVADPPRHPKYTRSMASSPSLDSSYHERERPSQKPQAPRYYWDQR